MARRTPTLISMSLILLFACRQSQSATLATAGNAHKGGSMDAKTLQTATLAGGCFWGVEELIRKLPGVVSTHIACRASLRRTW